MSTANAIWVGVATVAMLALGCAEDVSFTGAQGGAGGDVGVGGGSTSSTGAGGMASSSGSASGGMSASGGAGAGGFNGENNWRCLGTLPVPGFSPGTQNVEFEVRTLNGTTPVMGATVQVCALTDFLCGNALALGLTDGQGKITFPVTTAQPVFVQTNSAITTNTLQFINGAVHDGPPYAVTPFTPEELSTLASELGGTVVMAAGHVSAMAVDCDGQPASGVQFGLDNATGSTLFGYLGEDGHIDLTASETTSNGGAIFVNVPAGFATVSATLAAENMLLSNRVIFLRGGWVSDAAPHSPTPQAQ